MLEQASHKRINPLLIPIVAAFIFFAVWGVSFINGIADFNVGNLSQNYGSIIQGMSGLLGIVLAAAIFRIQSLESRIQSLENATLDYVFKIIGHTYPEWDERFEDNIKNCSITETYYLIRRRNGKSSEDSCRDKEIQQQGLTNNLLKHSKMKKAVSKIKWQVMGVSIFLIIPVAFSFLLLMTMDSLSKETNFFLLSLMIYMSILGIVLLLYVVFNSLIDD